MNFLDHKNNYNYLIILLSLLVYSSFFLGFYYDENSAGAGGYGRDFSLNWTNLQIFINNDLMTAINSTDGSDINNNYRSTLL